MMMEVPKNFVADPFAISHETPLDDDEPEVIVAYLGNDKEPALNHLFEGLYPCAGWYWIMSILPPRGPYETSKAAFDDWKSYISEK